MRLGDTLCKTLRVYHLYGPVCKMITSLYMYDGSWKEHHRHFREIKRNIYVQGCINSVNFQPSQNLIFPFLARAKSEILYLFFHLIGVFEVHVARILDFGTCMGKKM